MKRSSLLAAAAMVVIANALALGHAWVNRTGVPDAAVTLTQGELTEWNSRDTNSGLAFRLLWNGWDPDAETRAWASRRNLESLGFDYSRPAEHPDAPEFYRRQPPRRAWAALEIVPGRPTPVRVIDVAPDPIALRGRHPNATGIIILPAIVNIGATSARLAQRGIPAAAAEITGRISELPTRIHIPRPFSAELRRRKQLNPKLSFRLHLRYGSAYEPWVTGVDFPAEH